MFLEILLNLQESTCVRVPFLIKLLDWGLQLYLKKRLWHRCFTVDFAKFLRIPFYRTALSHCFWNKIYYNSQRGNQGPHKLRRDLSFNNNSFCLSKQIYIVFLLFFNLEDSFLIWSLMIHWRLTTILKASI